MAILFQVADKPSWVRVAPDLIPPSNIKEHLRALRIELEKPETTGARKIELMRSIWQTQLLAIRDNDDEKLNKILKWRESFESIRAIDLLALKRQRVPLYEYLFFNKKWALGPIKKEDLKSWEEFLVNFGANKYMKDSVGAGDILPDDVSSIEVNGKKAERKNIAWRPGYYAQEWNKWIYRPIYDGDIVKIISISIPDKEQAQRNKEVEEIFFKQRVMEDILENMRTGKDPRKELDYLSDAEYQEALTYVEQIKKERAERVARMPKAKTESEFLKNYGEYLDSVCAQFQVPQEVMMAIFRKETSGFSSTATNGDTGAHGLWQVVLSTWLEIQNKTLPRYGINGKILNRNDIKDQILAATCYIRERTDTRGGSIEAGIMWYFGVSSANFDDAKQKNPSVYAIMQSNGLSWPEWFEKAYIIWLGLSPGNIPSAYNTAWKNQLPKEEYDTTGLPFWLNPEITYESGDKVTWCGFTARENGENFWAIFPPIYNSSQALTRYSNDTSVRTNNPTTALSTAKESGANVLDIIFENSKWSDKGHRACGIIAKDGNCYVYDPYFAFGRSDMRTAIPYDRYMTAMIEGEWKTLVWIGFHTSDHKALKHS